jgi:hypothetical protein
MITKASTWFLFTLSVLFVINRLGILLSAEFSPSLDAPLLATIAPSLAALSINQSFVDGEEVALETWLILWNEAILHIKALYLQNLELCQTNKILLTELTRITHDLNFAQNEELINYLKSQQLEILEKMELNYCIWTNNKKIIIELEWNMLDYYYFIYIKKYPVLWVIKKTNKNWIDQFNFY